MIHAASHNHNILQSRKLATNLERRVGKGSGGTRRYGFPQQERSDAKSFGVWGFLICVHLRLLRLITCPPCPPWFSFGSGGVGLGGNPHEAESEVSLALSYHLLRLYIQAETLRSRSTDGICTMRPPQIALQGERKVARASSSGTRAGRVCLAFGLAILRLGFQPVPEAVGDTNQT
ncbi:MAG: hypothetical protein RL095_3965 [Verrucomicrobiota bacterium]